MSRRRWRNPFREGRSPFNSPTDVVNAAKAKPGEISYGSSGTGGSAHLAGALAEVMAGRVSFMFFPMVGIAEQVEQKRLKVLGVSTEKRHPDYPNAPTMSESDLPGFEEYTQRFGVVGPAGLPGPVVNRLNEPIRAWLANDLERWARVIKAANVKAE